MISFLLALYGVVTANAECKKVFPQEDFDLDTYVTGGTWYVHQQMEIQYLPKKRNYCVTANYRFAKNVHQDGQILVSNFAREGSVDGKGTDTDNQGFFGSLCAKKDASNKVASKLEVAPCVLNWLPGVAGPYWVVAAGRDPRVEVGENDPVQYDWAIISGGQPNKEGEEGCRTGTGVNNSGFWLFLRTQERDEVLINAMRGIAAEKGFDLSVLNDVEHEGCTYPTPPKEEEETKLSKWWRKVKKNLRNFFG